jgi:hypothetical protein
MNKKYGFLIIKLWVVPLLLIILLSFCGGSTTGPNISDFEIYYFSSDNLDAAADSTDLLIIVFRKASGENEEIKTVMTETEDVTLYNENGYTLELWATGGIYYIYPVMGGSKAYAVNTEGVVVEHDKFVSANTYMVHFIDSTTGSIDYTADIVENEDDGFLAIFRAPVNDTVDVDISVSYNFIRYGFEFDNEAGTGAVEFRTDPEGYVFRVERFGG